MKNNIMKIKDLINEKNIVVPEYQRPYKWTLKNVNQLIDDILLFKDKKAYRLGTIVLHRDKDEKFNIVDGQQRITTLILLLKAIQKNAELFNKFKSGYDKNNIPNTINLPDLKFSNHISIKNIKNNYQELEKRVKATEFDEHIVYFIIEKCEVVYIELDNITEAFQFFDSQNARGKDLAPHDLLKAFHLREMQDVSENEKALLVKQWEELDEEGKLASLFNDYLFRIRNWSRGNSARYFTKNDVDIFKGISIHKDTKEMYPYALLYQIVNVFVDDYNEHSSRRIDLNNISYPFSLDLPILNGKRFFEMITHYHNRIEAIKSNQNNEIIKLLNTYDGRHRTGDKYVRLLFECALIYYIDKFGDKESDKVISKLFVWAYKLRLELQAVRLASIDNKALETNIFKTIKDANTHHEVVNLYVENLENIKYEIVDIVEQFKKLGYYNGN
jgi:uncharacterized protein with ParB-like and HNH nuclease domain